jgi:hypothetical protein
MYPVSNTTGIRYLGNRDPGHMEVHALDQMSTDCQIEEILRTGHAAAFLPDALEQAAKEGLNECPWCLGGSTR